MKERSQLVLLAATIAGVLLPATGARADLFTGIYDRQALRHRYAGRLVKTRFPCPATGGQRTVYVYTPPGFDTNGERRYPVLALLHGTPGQPVDWIYKGRAVQSVEAAILAGKLPPCLVAFPDGGGPYRHGGSEWADSFDGRCKMESAIANCLTDFLQRRYRASANPNLWAIGGLSEGGFGAANIALHHPDRFRSVLAISTELHVNNRWKDATAVFGRDPKYRSYYSPIDRVGNIPGEYQAKLHFYVAVGEREKGLIPDCVAFAQKARAAGVDVALERVSGGHTWGFWIRSLRSSLNSLAKWWSQDR